MTLESPGVAVLIASAVLAAFRVPDLFPSCTKHRRDLWTMRGTIFFTWCILCVQTAGFLAECMHRPWFRPATAAGVSLAALAVLLFTMPRLQRASAQDSMGELSAVCPVRRRKKDILGWALTVPVACLYVLLGVECLLRPPNGYDGLFYHLPMIGRWLQSGYLFQPAFGIPEYWHPANCELWQWIFASLGIEWLIEFSMLPVGIFLLVVTYGVAREVGARPQGGWIVMLFVACVPMLAMQAYSSYVDLFMLTFVLAAWFWLVRAFRSHEDSARRVFAIMAGLCAGMAVGSKYTAAPWVLLVGGLYGAMQAAAIWLRAQPVRSAVRRLALSALLFSASAAVSSAAWFVRNTIHAGWPLYPMKIEVAGVSIGTGFDWQVMQQAIEKHRTRSGWQALAYPWFEWKGRGSVYSHGNGLGPAFATFALIGGVFLLWQIWRGRRRWADRDFVRSALIAAIFVGVGLWGTALNYHIRYALPVWVLALIAAGPCIDWLLHKHRIATRGLLVFTVALGSSMVGMYPAVSIFRRAPAGGFDRAAFYGLPQAFDRLEPGTVVLNAAEDRMNYPLAGRGFKYRVIECMNVWYDAIQLPLTPEQVDRHGIDVVCTSSQEEDTLFAAGVRYALITDERTGTTSDSHRLYRIIDRQ